MIEAILFDAGGTLWEWPWLPAEELRDLVGDIDGQELKDLWSAIHGRARSPEEISKARDTSSSRHREAWTRLFAPLARYGESVPSAVYERSLRPRSHRPFGDTGRVLTSLRRAGVPIGVVSDTGYDLRPVFRHHFGDAPLVDAFVLSYEHGRVKPHPELFHAACRELGVPPEKTLMVGDTPLTDGGAIDAGLPVLLLPANRAEGRAGLDLVLAVLGIDQ